MTVQETTTAPTTATGATGRGVRRRASARGARAVAAAAASLATCVALAGCAPASGGASPSAGGSAGSGQLTVFAAASLQKSFGEISQADATQEERFSFEGSSTLVDQLAGGARADVLATADKATMDRAVEKKLVGEPTLFATNHLVLVTPSGNPGKVTGLNASLTGKRLVICAPAVPCGRASQKLAGELGVKLQPVSEEQKVTDVLGKVRSGEADAGLVYTTDAAGAGDKVDTVEIPGAEKVINQYLIATVNGAPDPQGAQRFIAQVTSPQGRAILARYGFAEPTASATASPSGSAASASATPTASATK